MSGLRARHRRERQETILAAAEDLFKQQGYEGTTIAQIAERANISPVTVFNYYKTKGELLLALIAAENESLLARLDRMPSRNSAEPVPILVRFFLTIVEESLQKIDKASWRQVVATSVITAESEFGIAYSNMRSQIKSSLRALISRLVAKGFIPSEVDADALSDLCYTYHYGLFTDFISVQDRTLKSYEDELEAGLLFLVGDRTRRAAR